MHEKQPNVSLLLALRGIYEKEKMTLDCHHLKTSSTIGTIGLDKREESMKSGGITFNLIMV